MIPIQFSVHGPKHATTDDLINGARETIARAGYQVGHAQIVGPEIPGFGVMLIDAEAMLSHQLGWGGTIDLAYGDYHIEAMGLNPTELGMP